MSAHTSMHHFFYACSRKVAKKEFGKTLHTRGQYLRNPDALRIQKIQSVWVTESPFRSYRLIASKRIEHGVTIHCWFSCSWGFEDLHCKTEFNTFLGFSTKLKDSVKKQNHQNQISGQMRHARGVGFVQKSRYLEKQYCYIRNTCTVPYLVYFGTNLYEILAPCLKS